MSKNNEEKNGRLITIAKRNKSAVKCLTRQSTKFVHGNKVIVVDESEETLNVTPRYIVPSEMVNKVKKTLRHYYQPKASSARRNKKMKKNSEIYKAIYDSEEKEIEKAIAMLNNKK